LGKISGSGQWRTKRAVSARGSPLSVLCMLLRGNQMAVDAVWSELLSRQISLQTGKFTGKIVDLKTKSARQFQLSH
jgi:hypothetical protein